MAAVRPARAPLPIASYVLGLEGAVVVVPERIAAWLDRHAGLTALRLEHRGSDPEVDQVLLALAVASANWRTAAVGKDPRQEVAVEPQSSWLTAAEIADRLGISSRTVRWACQTGRLPAERVGSQWQVSRTEYEQYRASRAA